ncbi:4-alpha-glucanotransferase [Alkalicella caledoniensis]|uniref:4-alpha-glucanotransferase n=1 Tax=Alkalicella caledoniensis TaxID=2731377 RepID=A0A7G9W9V7_ALKCA|nr:4-alpha-glucanotransferase [Alkalicella caledoniensis]QNO15469.1 4-alpha-glucanotransferase [Alkalicella caledoniensis]
MKNRSSGILMHISSLPSDYGIGDFGKEAYNFVDFLVKGNQKNWQILPLGVTGYGDSPYQCFSAFAGNPYFIDLDELIELKFLSIQDVKNFDLGTNSSYVDYGLLYKNKMQLLRMAYKKAKKEIFADLQDFYEDNKDWLREFALYMSIKAHNNNKSWMQWDASYKSATSDAVIAFEKANEGELYFWVFTQYFFTNQWEKLKKYANKNGISIIGDLPIYVSEDSSDVWSNPSLFNLDEALMPITVAGCPPDAFSETGQLWGNPIYNWKAMEEDDYKWWIKRINHSFQLYDTLRIDHFRGFEAYWEVKYGSATAIDGKWVKGPGMKLFKKIKEELGDLDIIAEDLGYLTEDVYKLMEDSGFPGMKVLQFAFDSREESDYLPHNYNNNCVVYTGTHDNHTAMGWFENVPKEDKKYAIDYLKLNYDEGFNWGFLRGAWSSVAYLAVAPMQDFLALGDEARINIPSTIGTNWTWRMSKSDLDDTLAKKIAKLNKIYRR